MKDNLELARTQGLIDQKPFQEKMAELKEIGKALKKKQVNQAIMGLIGEDEMAELDQSIQSGMIPSSGGDSPKLKEDDAFK